MSYRTRTILLIAIQCVLVSTIAGKYLYERATRPRVWARVAQYDPNLPMRGRYLALSPLVNACSLPRDKDSEPAWMAYSKAKENQWYWHVRATARDGKLVVEDARNVLPRSEPQTVWLKGAQPCDRVQLTPGMDFFLPDTAKSPIPLKTGAELGGDGPVPPAGPPRPIQLAISDNGQWKPLKFE